MADRPAKADRRGAAPDARAPVAGSHDDGETDVAAAGFRRSLELLWGVEPSRPARGPKPALTVERIVEAALALADREGLGALSMARIAKELGFTTMSLYRYVRSKDELLMLIADAAPGPPPAMDGIEGWRDGLSRWAHAQRAAMQRHPWTLQVPITGPPIAPNTVAWMDAGLRALQGTGLRGADQAGVILLVAGFVRNEVGLQRDLTTHEDQQRADAPGVGTGAAPTYGDLLRLVVDAERFPALHAVLATDAFDDGSEYGDAEFEFGLTTLLDGVEALIERQNGARRRPRRH